MAKIKVHELAKELGKESKDIIAFLGSNGIEAKAQSGVEEDMVEKIRSNFGSKPKAEKKEAVDSACLPSAAVRYWLAAPTWAATCRIPWIAHTWPTYSS